MPEPMDADSLLEHRAFMIAIARDLLGDRAAAEDVAQDGLMAALKKPPRRATARAWLGAVARNLARTSLRSRLRREQRERRFARTELQPDPADGVARIEVQRLLLDAVRRLKEPYRSTVIARYLDDLSVREIAATQRVGIETVKTRLRRALVQLRNALDERYGGDTKTWSSLLIPSVFVPRSKFGLATGPTIMATKTLITLGTLIAIVFAVSLAWQAAETQRRSLRVVRPNAPDRARPIEIDAVSLAEAAAPPPVNLAAVDRHRDLHGTVVDRDGRPIANAAIGAIHRPWDRTDVLARFPGVAGVATTSSVDGTFCLSLHRGDVVDASFSRRGFAPVVLRKLQAGERVRVALAPAVDLTVTVLDHERQALNRATVSLRGTDDNVRLDRAASTSTEGRVRFRDLPSGAFVRLEVRHPLHGAMLDDPAVEIGTVHEFEVVLPKGRTFDGRVVDAVTGEPIAEASVGMNWDMSPKTRTDVAGRFRLNGFVLRMQQKICVVADGYARAESAARRSPDVVVKMTPEARLTGRVVEADGEPVPGARVAALTEFGIGTVLSLGLATSADDGTFTIAGLDPRQAHFVAVSATGFGRTAKFVELRGADRAVTDIGEIVLAPGRSIEGLLLDAHGLPVPRHVVELRGPRGEVRIGRRTMLHARGNRETRRTDDLGRFRFPELSAGQYVVSVEREGAVGKTQRVAVEDRDVLDVTLRFEETRSFVVRVETDEGDPVPLAYVRVVHAGGESHRHSDKDGAAEFHVRGAVREVAIRYVIGPGSKLADFGAVEPIVDVPETDPEVRIVLSRWGVLRGRAMIGDAPLSGAVVEVKWNGSSRTANTSDTGHFRVVVPPKNNLTVQVVGRDYEVASGVYETDRSYTSPAVKAVAGATGIVLRVEREKGDREVVVVVRDPSGAPVSGARVGYWPKRLGRAVSDVRTDENGMARIAGMLAREVSIYALTDADSEFLSARQQKIVPDGQTITLLFRAAQRVRGRVLMKSGEPAPSARLDLKIDGEIWGWNCDAHGHFDFPAPSDAREIDFKITWETPEGARMIAVRKGVREWDTDLVFKLKNRD